MRSSLFSSSYKLAQRVVVAVVGSTIVLFGALLFLPGPAFVVIPVGLGVLSLELAWARRWLRKMKEASESAWHRFRWLRKK
jgi:tellurite resistance protein TerC